MMILDAKSLLSSIDKTTLGINSLYNQISAIQRAVRDFSALDDVLKGSGGTAIRSFYNDGHQPFLIFLFQSLVDYKNVLSDIQAAIESYESHANGFVRQDFLESDITNGLENVKKRTIELTADANSILQSVQDLVSVSKIDESEVVDNVKRGNEKVRNMIEELKILDSYGVSCLEQTKDNLQTMKSYISELDARFSGGGSLTGFNVSAIKDLESYKTVKNSVFGHGEGTRAIKNRDFSERIGQISGSKKIGFSKMNKASKFVDEADNVYIHTSNLYTLQQAYELQKQGFKIEKYVTKGNIVKYRVYKPELVGINKSNNRNTKIYERKYINQQVKQGTAPKIAEKVNVKAGAVNGLKTKAGWLGVALGTGLNMKDNIESGASTVKIVGDAGVDVGIGAVSLAAAGAAAAFAIGTFGAPILAGAAIGVIASYAVSFVADLKIGDKSVSDHIKNGVQKGLKTIAGWFK